MNEDRIKDIAAQLDEVIASGEFNRVSHNSYIQSPAALITKHSDGIYVVTWLSNRTYVYTPNYLDQLCIAPPPPKPLVRFVNVYSDREGFLHESLGPAREFSSLTTGFLYTCKVTLPLDGSAPSIERVSA